MKKIISVLLCAILALSMAVFPAMADDGLSASDFDTEYYSKFKNDKITLYVYNWGEYIADGADGTADVIALFEELTGIEVEYTTFDTNEGLFSKLQSGSAYYDVVIPSDYMIARLAENGMLETLDFSNIPNYAAYIDEQFKNPGYDPEALYSVPYTWGTVGIIYNTKYITEEIDSWAALWNEEYADRILMFDNSRDSFAIALARLGYSINTENMDEINEAAELLREQKSLVQAYVMDQIFDKMVGENAWIAPYYAGDYLTMSADNPDLAFAFPKEGSNQFVDAMCIPKDCVNKEAAEMFINFMCEPLISAENCGYVGYSTPVSEAKNYMDEEKAMNAIAYPSDEILQNTEVFVNLSDDTNKMLDMLWISINVGGLSIGFWITVGVIALGVTGFCIYRMQKKKYRMAMRSRDL